MKSRLSMEEFLVAGIQGAASVEQQVTNQPDDTAASLRENMDLPTFHFPIIVKLRVYS
jgi:hypothetical protein